VIDEDAVLVGGPVVPVARSAPRLDDIAVLIKLNHRGRGLAALYVGVVDARFSRASSVPGRW